MSQVNPDDFIITRKRKKYKFAKFLNAENCFEFDEWLKARPCLISAETNLGVELGAGTGLFSVELASRHPDKTFVAIDVKADRLQKGAYQAIDNQLDNVYFVRARADQITDLFDGQSLDQLWLTFADPFPKKGSSGRRMTHRNYLSKYQTILKPTGSFLMKHDNLDFFTWSLEQVVAERWSIDELSFDLHDSELADDYKIQTTYEQRWLGEGRTVCFVRCHCV